jgi:hypothetical protein
MIIGISENRSIKTTEISDNISKDRSTKLLKSVK